VLHKNDKPQPEEQPVAPDSPRKGKEVVGTSLAERVKKARQLADAFAKTIQEASSQPAIQTDTTDHSTGATTAKETQVAAIEVGDDQKCKSRKLEGTDGESQENDTVDNLPGSVIETLDYNREPLSPKNSSNKLASDLIRGLSDPDAHIRARAEQALTKLGAQAVPSLIAQATLPDADETQEQAMDIITAMGIAAAPELLRIASDTSQPVVQRRKALSLLNASDLDPQLATPVLIQLFKGQDGNYLPDRASRFLAAIGLPAIPALMTALDEENEQIVRCAALTLGRLACQFKSPSQEIREALEQTVPKLAGLLANSLKEPSQDMHVRPPDPPFLFPLTAIATFSSKTAEAIALVKKMLAESREIRHFDREKLIRRLEDRLSKQDPDSQPQPEPQELASPTNMDSLKEERVDALVKTLPVDQGYTAFKTAWESVTKILREKFLGRLKQVLNNELQTKPAETYEQMKEVAAWVNQRLRENHAAIPYPETGQSSNLRAGKTNGESGRYYIERRAGRVLTPVDDEPSSILTIDVQEAEKKAPRGKFVGDTLKKKQAAKHKGNDPL
jgi:hypothetical protein